MDTNRSPQRPSRDPRRERGQTTQDFAIGIGVFLLVVAFVFTFAPTLITPFTADVGQPEAAQAERIAGTIVENASVDDRSNHVDVDTVENITDENEIASNLGVRAVDSVPIDRINVTVETLDGSAIVLTGGHDLPDGQASASAARIVTMDHATELPAYRIIVRVW